MLLRDGHAALLAVCPCSRTSFNELRNEHDRYLPTARLRGAGAHFAARRASDMRRRGGAAASVDILQLLRAKHGAHRGALYRAARRCNAALRR